MKEKKAISTVPHNDGNPLILLRNDKAVSLLSMEYYFSIEYFRWRQH